MKQLGAVIWALLTTIEVRLMLLGVTLALCSLSFQNWPYPPQREQLNKFAFPQVDPFFRPLSMRTTAANVWSHYDWRDVQSEVQKTGPEQALEVLMNRAAFSFLPRSAEYRGEQEAGQPEHLYEVLPDLQRLSLIDTVVTAEDWRDIGRLQKLWWLEVGGVEFPEGETVAGVQVASEALSAIPQLRHLNITGNSWIRPAGLQQLESLALEASRLEEVLAENKLAQLPKLKVLYLWLGEDFRPTSSQIALLQRLEGAGIERVELWTGRVGQRGWLRKRVDELRGQVPGLDIRSGEAGFGLGAMMSALMLYMSVLGSGLFLASLLILPQNGFIPGFDRLRIAVPVCNAMFTALVGAAFAIFLELRWWPLAALAVLWAGASYSLATCRMRYPNLNWLIHIVWFTVVLVAIGMVSASGGLFMQSILGDVPAFNITVPVLSVLCTVFAIASGKELHVIAAERPGLHQYQSASIVKGFDSSIRIKTSEQWQVGASSAAMLASQAGADFSDKLRFVNRLMTKRLLRGAGVGIMFGISAFVMNLVIASRDSNMPDLFSSWQRIATLLKFLVSLVAGTWGIPIMGGWMQRSRRLAADFLFPAGRQEYWQNLRRAVLRDFRWPLLLSMVAVSGFAAVDDATAAISWAQRVPHLVFVLGHWLLYSGATVLCITFRRTEGAVVAVFITVMMLTIVATVDGEPLQIAAIWYLCAALAATGYGLWLILPKVMQDMEVRE